MPGASGVHWYLCLLWLVVSPISYGQPQAPSKPDTSFPSWAVVADVGPDFSIHAFQEAGLAAQYNFSRSLAIRVELSGRYEVSRPDGDGGIDPNDLAAGYYLLAAQFLAYTRPTDRRAIFYGAGPIIGYDWKGGKGIAGVESVVGAELFANDWLSFHAEYGIAVTYRWYVQEEPIFISQRIYSESSKHVWTVSTGATRLGASIYF